MTTRRGHGENSVYREGSRWRGSIDLGRDLNGKRVRKKVSGKTKTEVLGKLRALRQEIDSGVRPDDRLTTGTFLRRWIETNLDGQMSQKTRDSYADNVRLHLSPALGEIVLRRLTVAQVDALWSQKRREGYSGNSIRLMRSTLRRGLAQAEKEGLVLRNVAALSGAPRINAKEGRSLTVDEAKSLLAGLEGHRLEPLVTLMLIFGLRRGEALGLHWREYDRDKRTLRVTHSVKRVQSQSGAPTRTHLEIGDLKTKRSRRTLYLSPELVDVLRRHRARQAEDQVAAGASWQEHGLIFTTEVGTPLDPDNFSHTFSRLTKAAGLGHWNPHELRHSGASLMLAQGTDLYVVSEVLGHASIAITKDVYGHLVEGHKRTASESMADALLDPHGSQFGSHGALGAS